MTHGVHFLPQVDQIIVIEDGRISEVCSTLHYLSRLPAKSYVEKKSDSTVAKKKKKKTDEGSSFLAFVPTFSTNSRGNACYAGLVTVL